MKIAIAGAGYVGFSLGIAISEYHEVVLYEIDPSKVKAINKKTSPLVSVNADEINVFLKTKTLNLTATTNKSAAYNNANFVIIATPTNYDPVSDSLDTSSVKSVVNDVIQINPNAIIIIKSTVPIGFTKNLRKEFKYNKIIFSPEFLREGKALSDILYPSRIIVGDTSNRAKIFATLMKKISLNLNVPILFTTNNDAEAIKLFSNCYLAMRVAYFNELDSYAHTYKLNSDKIIQGVCMDPRIGMYYNNPSFGYGGYCLPKDTKQLLTNYSNTPQKLIHAIIESNLTRKKFISEKILKLKPKIVGIYRLVMDVQSTNFRSSSILDILEIIKNSEIQIIIYEPILKDKYFKNFKVIKNLNKFKTISDIIVANRVENKLSDVLFKVFTRDLIRRD